MADDVQTAPPLADKTLLDEAAFLAMQSMIPMPEYAALPISELAKKCYSVAWQMMAARPA